MYNLNIIVWPLLTLLMIEFDYMFWEHKNMCLF